MTGQASVLARSAARDMWKRSFLDLVQFGDCCKRTPGCNSKSSDVFPRVCSKIISGQI